MSLQDYSVPRDKFDARDNGYMIFPCWACVHVDLPADAEPCRTCDHNLFAEDDAQEVLLP